MFQLVHYLISSSNSNILILFVSCLLGGEYLVDMNESVALNSEQAVAFSVISLHLEIVIDTKLVGQGDAP